MFGILKRYRNLSTSKQIGLTVALNFLMVLTVITLTLMIVFTKIQISQQESPSQFIETYDEKSLNETTTLVKNLIISIIDYRASYITSVANVLKNNLIKTSPLSSTSDYNSNNSTSYCSFTSPSTTLFRCSMDIYSKFVMEEGWIFQKQKCAKRFNIIYQNKQNTKDLMIKTIPAKNFSNLDTDIVATKIKKLKQNTLMFTPSYFDLTTSNESLVSFQVKLNFENYTVLLQMVTDSRQVTRPLKRVLYSDDQTNVAVLALNNNSSTGYDFVASYNPLDQAINFTNLLQTGSMKIISKNQDRMLTKTIPISSEYELGTLNFANQVPINNNYVVIVYAHSISSDMQTTLFGFINNLLFSLRKILAVLLVILIAAASVLLMHSIGDIGNNLKIFLQVIKQYSTNMNNYDQIINCKNQKIYPLMRSNSVLRLINMVIKTIQHKRRDFKRKCYKFIHDKFPTNLLDQQFQNKQQFKDFQRYEQIYDKIKELSEQNDIKQQIKNKLTTSKLSLKYQ